MADGRCMMADGRWNMEDVWGINQRDRVNDSFG